MTFSFDELAIASYSFPKFKRVELEVYYPNFNHGNCVYVTLSDGSESSNKSTSTSPECLEVVSLLKDNRETLFNAVRDNYKRNADRPNWFEAMDFPTVTNPADSLSAEPVSDIIISLNDKHGWSREKIADWLDSLDLDLTIPMVPFSFLLEESTYDRILKG